jgi:hypothetical protein
MRNAATTQPTSEIATLDQFINWLFPSPNGSLIRLVAEPSGHLAPNYFAARLDRLAFQG